MQIDGLDQQLRLAKEKAVAAGVHEDELVFEDLNLPDEAKSEAMRCRLEVKVLTEMNDLLEETRLSLLTQLRTLTIAAVDTDVDSGVGSALTVRGAAADSDEGSSDEDSDGGRGRRKAKMSKSIRRATGLAHLNLDRKERLQVFEFAVNLQNGVAKLPLDDRSAHFKKELERATKERDQMRAALAVFKTEMGGGGGSAPVLDAAAMSRVDLGSARAGGAPYGMFILFPVTQFTRILLTI